MQNDLDNIYMKKSMACFAIDTEKLPIVKLSYVMPFLIPILTQIVKIRIFIIHTLYKTVPSLVSEGRKYGHVLGHRTSEKSNQTKISVWKETNGFTSIDVGCCHT